MKMVVQKYGGSSLETPERIRSIAGRIAQTQKSGARVVVVVSAMGGTTDDLMRLAQSVHPSPPKRELDMLLTVGERISMALLSMALERFGVAAISFTGSQSGIFTDTRHAEARILEVRGKRILEALDREQVVIIAGFQGVSSQNEVTTLGRGGSDTTAAALAATLGAERCEICTDVDGVFTADPRLVSRAKLLPQVDYEEMKTLATYGAQVLHPRSVQVAQRFNIPLLVRSSFREEPGTEVLQLKTIEPFGVRGLAHFKDVTLVSIHCPSSETARVLETWTALEVNVLALSEVPDGAQTVLHCLIECADSTQALESLKERLPDFDPSWLLSREDVASITAVGRGMTMPSALYSKMIKVLEHEGIAIHFAQSTPLSVTCVVDSNHLQRGLEALHQEFGLDD